MRKQLLIASALLGTLLVATACSGSTESTEATPTDDPMALATELIYEYGEAIYNRDQEALGDLLSDAFLLRRTDGSGFTRQGFLDAIAEGSDYELVDFELSDITAQLDGDILVTTFTQDDDIIENGKSVVSEPSPSLVTFVRVDGQWKVASEAFFSK